ncbi:hypothetical protein [Hymenobacter latericus]|uniref:hypothetical protein n=1 Tax=Hymenobacter sp. YIM 151858-1 TaxID=2987688 RepID=UPI0022260530|nr:hypothetical protein [Hymenobacter sp. YIM 151858-1]UYZ60157.1 hypothetical protein OIS50_04980 [Hymenobacter sp. YIM 151858-1]
MKAYIVTENEEHHACVVFADHAVTARRKGADELNTDFTDDLSVKRAKHFDQYAPQGSVPLEVLVMEHGWSHECDECSERVTQDLYNYQEERDMQPVWGQNFVYCSPECEATYNERKAKEKAEYDALVAKLLAEYPGVTPKYRTTNGGLSLRFPGAKHDSYWQPDKPGIGALRMDVPALYRYLSTIRPMDFATAMHAGA